MNRKIGNSVKATVALGVGAVMTLATVSYANNQIRTRDCLPGVYCLDVWQPVTCSNGQVYSNSCYAAKACATGCVPGILSQ